MRRQDVKNKIYDSKCGNFTARGTASQVAQKYEIEARRLKLEKDHRQAENMLQHAEYYKKLAGGAI